MTKTRTYYDQQKIFPYLKEDGTFWRKTKESKFRKVDEDAHSSMGAPYFAEYEKDVEYERVGEAEEALLLKMDEFAQEAKKINNEYSSKIDHADEEEMKKLEVLKKRHEFLLEERQRIMAELSKISREVRGIWMT